MYSVFDYGSMIRDRRADAYAEALRRSVKPGDTVLDMGAGVGIWAMYVCTLGARHVTAIEPLPAINVAREVAQANGFADRITFIQDVSTRVQLDEPADVIVADVRGVLPLAGRGVEAMIDARRLLRPGGAIIPCRDTLMVAVVEAPDQYEPFVQPWEQRAFGLDFRSARSIVLNTWRKERIRPEQFLTGSACWGTLDYPTLTNPDVDGGARLTVRRAGTAHGLVLWFESDLVEGVRLSNAPDQPKLIYGHGFFPWLEPVAVAEGDTIVVNVRAKLMGEDYVWRWQSTVVDAEGRERKRFDQSTMHGAPLAVPALARLASTGVGRVGHDGVIDGFVLSALDGTASIGEVAHRLAARFPESFPTQVGALTRVAQLVERYRDRDEASR